MKYLTITERDGKLFYNDQEWVGGAEALHDALCHENWKRVVRWGDITGTYARSEHDEHMARERAKRA